MSEVLQTNIFFFITGIAVIVISALLCVLLFHGIKIMRSLRRIVDRIEEGSAVIAEDIQNVRAYFAEGGFVQRFIRSLVGESRESQGQKSKAKKQEKKRTELTIKDEA